MANPPYPFRDRSRDHLASWEDDDGMVYVDGKPAFIETWLNGKPHMRLLYPVRRKAIRAFVERMQARANAGP